MKRGVKRRNFARRRWSLPQKVFRQNWRWEIFKEKSILGGNEASKKHPSKNLSFRKTHKDKRCKFRASFKTEAQKVSVISVDKTPAQKETSIQSSASENQPAGFKRVSALPWDERPTIIIRAQLFSGFVGQLGSTRARLWSSLEPLNVNNWKGIWTGEKNRSVLFKLIVFYPFLSDEPIKWSNAEEYELRKLRGSSIWSWVLSARGQLKDFDQWESSRGILWAKQAKNVVAISIG